jgi:alpha-glucosidase
VAEAATLADPAARPTGAPDPDWWRGAVIYQIYPRSFQDSDGDGVGDLRGIVARLPYVAGLGVDAIWISPFFRSPMLDFGYDVSDYLDVDPMFGTLGDFDALVGRAHDLGLRVMIDLVLSHTSDRHPWFRESRSSRDNPRADWYVWADAKPDGTAPNNWLSIFGGPAWEWDTERQQYYMHNFLKEQPDLNFHCPAVQDALLDVARFWLARGVDGFRLDTINFYVHDAELRDNPVLPRELRDYSTAPEVNPYNWQDHLYDKSRPENLEFLRRLREVMDERPAITSVGEVGDAQRSMEIVGAYTSGRRVHMCYAFEFLSGSEPPGGDRIAEVLRRFEHGAPEGWACWAMSNHDVERHASRWRLSEAQIRLYAAILLSLRGSVCLYQGEELGLPEALLAYEDLRDPYGIRMWPKFRGRDGCRTPIPWANDNTYAGFSETRPWLPAPPEHLSRAVSLQNEDPDSTLNFYRRLLTWRRGEPALARGDFAVVAARHDLIAYTRSHGGRTVLCAFNLGDAPARLPLPAGVWRAVEKTGFTAAIEGAEAALPTHQALFATRG